MAQQQLLLLEDVDSLGRSGDVVQVKPGYARNFLIPQQKAVVADKNTLRLRERLQQERTKRAAEDRQEAEMIASRIDGIQLSIEVKVDPEGHLYGSVSQVDIVNLLAKEGLTIERRHVVLAHAIKSTGEHTIPLRLKEGIPAQFTLQVNGIR
ncbi:MAG: rplI [Chlamydiales bacterium]|jgi:large subunit ribosomal protein L9|nr:rplI [Chlamydiales bacterium]